MNGIKVFRTDYKGSFQGIKVFPSYKRLTKMQGLVLFRLQNSKKTLDVARPRDKPNTLLNDQRII